MARDSFKTFIPLSVDNPVRSQIIFDFFDLLSAIAAHGKMNGFGGRKLSRMAAWWAFEHKQSEQGFEGGYNAWLRYVISSRRFLVFFENANRYSAADATSHLFFAYLRSLAPPPVPGGISLLPMSLQKLLQETEYPPQRPALMQSSTNRVAMIVETVSPTPFALLRRANHFQYRDDDRALREWSEYDDPIKALTEECRRVLRAVSAANQSQAVSNSKISTSLRDASWSRFEDIGFTLSLEEEDEDDDTKLATRRQQGLRNTPASGDGLARPTTPSWADFLSSGFVDDRAVSPSLLPPDKVLPPIETTVRQRSSQSHNPRLESDPQLEPGELASIVKFDLDDAFWWVWMLSLAPEETPERKAVFGRCAVIETIIRTGRWLVMEEIVKGAAPDPAEGAYIAEKKGFFSWTRRSKGINRRKSTAGKNALKGDGHLRPSDTMGLSKTSIGPDQQARIQAAALQLQRQEQQKSQHPVQERRGRTDSELMNEKTNSVFTLQPSILSEASPAVKWANKYDKDKEAIREAYLANESAGRGISSPTAHSNGFATPTTNGYDQPPELPPKSPSLLSPSSPTGLPESPSFVQSSLAQRPETPEPPTARMTDKSFEAPKDVHPIERVSHVAGNTPLPPPKTNESMDLAREAMVSPEPDLSPESKKQKKLHKEMGKSTSSGGFRKLFARKNRSSKVPDNAAEKINAMISVEERAMSPPPVQTAAPARPPVPVSAPVPAQAPVAVEPTSPVQALPDKPPVMRGETQYVTPREEPTDPLSAQVTPVAPAMPSPARKPVASEDTSRVNTADALEAKQEFSRFDQGPLLDQPAFIPDEEGDVEEAVPPPIARHPSQSPTPSPQPAAGEAAPAPDPIPRKVDPQDRWAQIRKNAAERAAQRLQAEKMATGAPKPIEIDDDTSGEESKLSVTF